MPDRPIAGATVVMTRVGKPFVTETDGWYRLDLGCPNDAWGPRFISSGTTFLNISHPKYVALSVIQGHGISGAYRGDWELQPK